MHRPVESTADSCGSPVRRMRGFERERQLTGFVANSHYRPMLFAVGMRITAHPRTDPSKRYSRTRLPPRVFDVEALRGPRVKDARLWEPVVSQLRHLSPGEIAFLAASAKCPTPALGDPGSKGSQRSPVCWHCVVVEETGDDLPQPFALFGDRLMHPPSQFPCNILDLRLQAEDPSRPHEGEDQG